MFRVHAILLYLIKSWQVLCIWYQTHWDFFDICKIYDLFVDVNIRYVISLSILHVNGESQIPKKPAKAPKKHVRNQKNMSQSVKLDSQL